LFVCKVGKRGFFCDGPDVGDGLASTGVVPSGVRFVADPDADLFSDLSGLAADEPKKPSIPL
jgi:hypothetical protein